MSIGRAVRAFAVAATLVAFQADAQADTCGSRICVTPALRVQPRCVGLLNGHVFSAWIDGPNHGMRAMLSDSGGRPLLQGLNGVTLGPDSVLIDSAPILLRLSDSVLVEAHSERESLGQSSSSVLTSFIRLNSATPLDPMQTQSRVLQRPPGETSQRVVGLVRRDAECALLVLSAAVDGQPPAYTRIVAAPTSDSLAVSWPTAGTVLADTCALNPIAACTDGASGCLVLMNAVHACVPDFFHTCPTELRLFHVAGTGDQDPAWPSDGLRISLHPDWDKLGQLVPDGSGGAYVAWQELVNDTLRVVATHVAPNGTIAPGWDSMLILSRTPTLVQQAYRIASSESGRLIAVVTSYILSAPLLVEREFDGTVAAGWPDLGVSVVGPLRGPTYNLNKLQVLPMPAGKTVVAWTETDYANSSNFSSLRAAAFGSTGQQLVGWPYGGEVLCPNLIADISISALSPNAFAITWQDTDVFLSAYHVVDGSTPTLAHASLLGYEVDGGVLTARWHLSGSAGLDVGAVRRTGDSADEAIAPPRMVGAEEFILTDALPASHAELRYSLTGVVAGHRQMISDALVLPATFAADQPLRLTCPVLQAEAPIAYSLDRGRPGEQVAISLFDLAGRRVAHTALTLDPSGRSSGVLRTSPASGVYVLQVRRESGERVSRRIVRIR